MSDGLKKEDVQAERPLVIPNFPPFFMMVIISTAYIITNPRILARAVVSIVFGIAMTAIVAGFCIHLGIDAFNWAWNLWGGL